jgi:hypothetical protein
MHQISANFVLRLLTEDQRIQCISICKGIRQWTNDKNFLKNVNAKDETQVYAYDTQRKQQAPQWKSPGSQCIKKAWQVHSKVKTILSFFFPCLTAMFFMSRFQGTRLLISLFSWSSEECESCSVKKTTGNMDCRNVAPPSWHQLIQHQPSVHQLAQPSQFECFWQSSQFLSFHNLPVCLTSSYLLYSPNLNDPGKKISNGTGHNCENDRWTEGDSTNTLRTMLPEVEKAVGVVYY